MQRTASRHESQIQVQETPSTFHPRAQRNAFRRRDARQQRRLFARWNLSLRRSPTPTGFAEIAGYDFQTVRRFHRLIGIQPES